MLSLFEEELAKLRKRMIKMFSLVRFQLDKAFEQLSKGEAVDFELVKKNENKIDKLDVKIDKLCQRIFALAQPVATDLRFIMASLKIDNELERMGDIAYQINERSEAIHQLPQIVTEYKVDEMIKLIINIFHQASSSYATNNPIEAHDIIQSSKQIKIFCNEVFNEIIQHMAQKEDVIVVATDLILVLRNLERLAEHVENIAESIVFLVEGKIIKHAGLKIHKPSSSDTDNPTLKEEGLISD
jgi:phosphate transport system protein